MFHLFEKKKDLTAVKEEEERKEEKLHFFCAVVGLFLNPSTPHPLYSRKLSNPTTELSPHLACLRFHATTKSHQPPFNVLRFFKDTSPLY